MQTNRWILVVIISFFGVSSVGCGGDHSGALDAKASRPDAQSEAGGGDASIQTDGNSRQDGSVAQDGGDGAAPSCLGDRVARYDTVEIVVHGAQQYSAASGVPNPFTDVSVSATVTAPDSRVFEVDGFFDGDGSGGGDGDVFKVRVFVDQPGQWSYRTHSVTDSALDGHSGQFCGHGVLTGRFGAGPVMLNPAHSRSFMYETGQPVYLTGKFLDVAAPDPIKFSHTMFSEDLSDSDRQQMLNRQVAMSLNKINVYLANRGDYGAVSTTPWIGDANNNDKTRFDLGRWHMYETWVRQIRDAGLVAQLWFFADDSNFGSLPDADKQRLLRYGMARLSGYVNTMFTLCLEWQEGWSSASVNTHGSYIQGHNPWKRLVSVHGVTGNFDFPTEAWADYMDIQSGNDANYSTVHAMALHNRGLASKPLINEEFGLGDENQELRQRVWASFTAGGAGSGTGAFLKQFVSFTSQVPFEQMEPADDLVISHNAYCLAEAGAHYVVYLYDGGSVNLDLTAASGNLTVIWYDPRAGTQTSGNSVAGGAVRSFTAPGSGDWALFVSTP